MRSLVKILQVICAVAISMLLIVAFGQALLRYFADYSIVGSTAFLTQYVMPILVLFGVALMETDDGHIRISIVAAKLTGWKQKVSRIVGLVIALIFSLLSAVASIMPAVTAFQRGTYTSGDITFPLWTVLSIAPAALTLLTSVLAYKLVREIIQIRGVSAEEASA